MHNIKGFTLIEIIVVLIILGVLASLALPAYFNWIKRSQAFEAIASMGSIKSSFVPCLRSHQGNENVCFHYPISNCSGLSPNIACRAEVSVGSPQFTYSIENVWTTFNALGEVIDEDPQGWTIKAVQNSNDYIVLSANATDSQINCTGLGVFKGVC